MKQHITKSQIDELSDVAKKRLNKWAVKNGQRFELHTVKPNFDWRHTLDKQLSEESVYPLLSIGQMIGFLSEYGTDTIASVFKKLTTTIDDPNDDLTFDTEVDIFDVEKLCDSLWEAVKEILGK